MPHSEQNLIKNLIFAIGWQQNANLLIIIYYV
jgi:hypothetical protein